MLDLIPDNFYVIAREEGGEWVQIIIAALIIMFSIIGPIIKKITSGVTKNEAKRRGVKPYKEDETKPSPRSAEEVAVSIMDEIAEAFRGEKKKTGRAPKFEELRKPEPRTGPEPEFRYPGKREQRKTAARRKPRPVAPTFEVLEKKPIQKREIGARLKHGDVSTPALDEVTGIDPAGVKPHGVDVLSALPPGLTQNQKAMALVEILGPPRALSEERGSLYSNRLI